MHSVYVILSKKDGKLYTGYAKDVKVRLAEHTSGRVQSNRDRRPLDLIYCETHKNRKDAMQREQYLKTGWGRRYLYKILQNTLRK